MKADGHRGKGEGGGEKGRGIKPDGHRGSEEGGIKPHGSSGEWGGSRWTHMGVVGKGGDRGGPTWE